MIADDCMCRAYYKYVLRRDESAMVGQLRASGGRGGRGGYEGKGLRRVDGSMQPHAVHRTGRLGRQVLEGLFQDTKRAQDADQGNEALQRTARRGCSGDPSSKRQHQD
jgi:hypothetical protein